MFCLLLGPARTQTLTETVEWNHDIISLKASWLIVTADNKLHKEPHGFDWEVFVQFSCCECLQECVTFTTHFIQDSAKFPRVGTAHERIIILFRGSLLQQWCAGVRHANESQCLVLFPALYSSSVQVWRYLNNSWESYLILHKCSIGWPDSSGQGTLWPPDSIWVK